MNIKIGDTVAVIDDVFKGKVTAIKAGRIEVETDDGFTFEFAPNELVVVNESQKELSKFSDINHEVFMEKLNVDTAKKKSSASKPLSKKEKSIIMEVDLHIHQLTNSTRGMDKIDMLTLQLNTAKHKLEYAIRNRIPKIVFIHGVGEGVLKTELDFLFNNYPVEVYAADFKKYGIGATEVYIYQNPKD